ncbi:MAG: hypothetical protein GX129_10300 [Clostridiales bacterium]|jgi:hypothetical protein|nr:hypothetical protein [Clostridiales bacterium]
MKLKYKKIILLTSLSTMGIGLLTLSISQGKPKAEEQTSTASGIVAEAQVSDDGDDISTMAAMDAALDNTEGAEVKSMPTLSPTPIPTPTPIPVYPLEEMEGMDAFIEVFFNAKASSDVDKLKSIYLDPSKVETREQLQKLVQYIEEYNNIKTYSKKSFEEGAYIVYAYHEIKFSSINTLAPGLSKFYVITDENGNFKIVSDKTPEVEEYFNARNEDEDVIELINNTNAKGEEAKARDEDLLIFWNGLDELAKSNEEQSTQNGGNNQANPGE